MPSNSCAQILYDYQPANNSYQLTLNAAYSSNIVWVNTATGAQLGTGQQISLSVPDPCQMMSICAFYYNTQSGCYNVCSLKLWLCNPFDCDYIAYNFNGDDAYELTFTGSGSQITWYNDDTNQQIGTGLSVEIPLQSNCYQFNGSARYYDSTCGCWKVCCISIWVCNPYDCNDIAYAYNGLDGYELTFTGDGTNLTWYDDDTGEELGAGTSVVIPLEPTCYQFNGSIRYYDEIHERWVICCISIWVCNPYDCNDIAYAYSGLDGYELTFTGDGTNLTWYDDDTGEELGTGTSVMIPLGPTCYQFNGSIRYYDIVFERWGFAASVSGSATLMIVMTLFMPIMG
ncbi:MAG: hypothetical protein IPH04_09730 [Saprospirales bacterium]|nr:hypothetical protein [Saprospirales bacterium]